VKFSSNETGCLKEDSFYVDVIDTPSANILPPITICSSAPDLDLDSRVTNIQPSSATGVWTGWNVNSSKYFDPQSKDSAIVEGPYKMYYELTNSSGCKGHYEYLVSVRSQPEVQITTSKPLQGCERQPFGVQSAPKYSNNNAVLWSTINGSDGTIDNASATNITYQHGLQDSANKMAWLRVSTIAIANEVCPQATDSIQIILHQFPQISMTGRYDTCVPFTTGFTGIESKGIPAGQLAWKWDFGNGDSSSLQNPTNVTYSVQGRYNVKLKVINTAGPCETEWTEVNFIQAYPNPVADFTSDPPFSTTIALPRFTMTNKSTLDKTVFTEGALTYMWDFDDPITDPKDTSTLENPRYSYGKDTNTYYITLTATSEKGCKSTFTRQVVVGPDIIVFIPDVFTPDGAGPNRNNTFMISAQNYRTMKMMIYNRWGEKMYETDDINKGWDGRANGANCQQDVYVYHIEVMSFEGKLYKFDGTVTLLR
jgi:gliding motility-associated-like protein